METCDTLFVVEGTTDLPVLRSCLERIYGAEEGGILTASPLSERPEWFRRSKFRVLEHTIGLFNAEGKDKAYTAVTTLVDLARTGMLPNLRLIVLGRDLDEYSPQALRANLVGRLGNFARTVGMTFVEHNSGVTVGNLGEVVVAQVLLGDPEFGSLDSHTEEDHIVQFLQLQRERDPSWLVTIVEDHLGRGLNLKQQVQLAMVIDGYWTTAGGFYERVLGRASDEELRWIRRLY